MRRLIMKNGVVKPASPIYVTDTDIERTRLEAEVVKAARVLRKAQSKESYFTELWMNPDLEQDPDLTRNSKVRRIKNTWWERAMEAESAFNDAVDALLEFEAQQGQK